MYSESVIQNFRNDPEISFKDGKERFAHTLLTSYDADVFETETFRFLKRGSHTYFPFYVLFGKEITCSTFSAAGHRPMSGTRQILKIESTRIEESNETDTHIKIRCISFSYF